EAGALRAYGTTRHRATLAARAGMDLILCSAQQAVQGDQARISLARDYRHRTLDQAAFPAAVQRGLALPSSLRGEPRPIRRRRPAGVSTRSGRQQRPSLLSAVVQVPRRYGSQYLGEVPRTAFRGSRYPMTMIYDPQTSAGSGQTPPWHGPEGPGGPGGPPGYGGGGGGPRPPGPPVPPPTPPAPPPGAAGAAAPPSPPRPPGRPRAHHPPPPP